MSEPCTCERCIAKQARVLAFGAIRRAVSVARKHDARAEKYLATIFEHVSAGRFRDDDYLVDIEMSANNAWHCQSCARAIRDAIRAALRSEKA